MSLLQRKAEPRSTRPRKQVSYKDLSDSSDELSTPSALPPRRKARAANSSARRPRLMSRRKSRLHSQHTSAATASTSSSATVRVESDGIIPRWAELPYEVLLSILYYAAHPLVDTEHVPTASVNWLLGAARVSKSFAEPAISVLYHTPPLHSIDQPHNLLALLKQSSRLSFDYGRKIKQIRLQAHQTLAYSMPGKGYFSLAELLPLAPNIAVIEIVNPNDTPPYRTVSNSGRWHYPLQLFSTLEQCGIRLSDWRWNGDMLGDILPHVVEIHASQPFQTLRHLSVSHLQLIVAKDHSNASPKNQLNLLSLLPLKQMDNMTIECCTCDDWGSFYHVLNDLVHLTIVNCSQVNAEDLAILLYHRGRHMKTITLYHNQSLGLDFLSDLASSCPQLEALDMDFTLYSAYLTHRHDADPTYESLLSSDSLPTWPSSLRYLELYYLRKLPRESAETLFCSLVSSAPNLLQLRRLVIRAMLDISWRERAGFREKWITSMTEVFLRRSVPPDVHLASKRAFKRYQDTQVLEQRRVELGNSGQGDSQHLTGGTTSANSRQGLCDVVEIQIDNMRPQESRFNESDFMDAETSGDEDYTLRATQTSK